MAFKLRSGNRTSFKEMGSAFAKSSPMKVDPPTKEEEKSKEIKLSEEQRPTASEEAGYAYEQKYGVKYEDDYDNPDRELPATEMSEAKDTKETTVERTGVDKLWQTLKGNKHDTHKEKKTKKRKNKDVIFADSISEQEQRKKDVTEGKTTRTGKVLSLPSETITDADGTKRTVQFKSQEERDRYMANIDKETGKKINPYDVDRLKEGETPEHTELSEMGADTSWKEKGQEMIDDPKVKAYWRGDYSKDQAIKDGLLIKNYVDDFAEDKQKKYDMDGDGIADSDNQQDEAWKEGKVPEWRQQQFMSDALQDHQKDIREVEDEIRGTAKTADKTGITDEHEAIDFSEFGEGDTSEYSLKNPEKYKDQRTKYVVDKKTGEITEKVKRKGPAGWVGGYKKTGRKKKMDSYIGAAEDKQKESASEETSSKKTKNKKEKTKKPKKEKKNKEKKNKEKKKKKNTVYDPAQDAWKN